MDWLGCEISDRLASGHPWQQAVARGMAARLTPRGNNPIELMGRLLAGEPLPEFDKERAWARSLSAERLVEIEGWALAEAKSAVADFEYLFDNSAPEDARWCSDVLDVMHRRDNVEGVKLLLREAGAGQALQAVLEDLDGLCTNWMGALQKWPGGWRDERTRRSFAINPTVWWVQPAAWEVRR